MRWSNGHSHDVLLPAPPSSLTDTAATSVDSLNHLHGAAATALFVLVVIAMVGSRRIESIYLGLVLPLLQGCVSREEARGVASARRVLLEHLLPEWLDQVVGDPPLEIVVAVEPMLGEPEAASVELEVTRPP
jgi:hypothetical protein